MEAQAFEIVVSPSILAEYGRVFRYERLRAYHKLAEAEIVPLIDSIRQFAIAVGDGEPLKVIVEDPDDDKFLACAVNGGADYIISGDAHLLNLKEYRGIQILTPAVFFSVIKA